MLIGQLIFRDTGTRSPTNLEGYKLMMVCGVISVPDDWQGKGGHQYVVTGLVNNDVDIRIHFDTGVDLTDKIAGMCLNQLITSPLWRV